MSDVHYRRTDKKSAQVLIWAIALGTMLALPPAWADIGDLRITEVDPWNQEVEVTNVNGGAFMLSTEILMPYNFDYYNYKHMSIVPGMMFGSNTIWVFTLPDMYTGASDVWLYRNEIYDNPGSIIHGVQFGTPPPGLLNADIAAQAGKWPSKTASCPMPPPGCTLAWNGDGNTPLDWYVDSTPTMGQPNVTVDGSVNQPFNGPHAQQNFEMASLGDQVTALKGWTMSSSGSGFNVRFVADVNGRSGLGPVSSSQHWLRIRDNDASGNNAFFSPPVEFSGITSYRCTFCVNQEIAPTASGTLPMLVIQISSGENQWVDAWGLRFKNDAVQAVVLAGGGAPAAANLYDLNDGWFQIGRWREVSLMLDLANHKLLVGFYLPGVVLASGAKIKTVSLPINPVGNPLKVRLAYHGEGAGNTQDMLLDDVELAPWDPPKNAVKGWADFK